MTRIWIHLALFLSWFSLSVMSQLCALLPPTLDLLANIATCSNIQFNRPIDAYLSIVDDLPLDDCISQTNQQNCLTVIQNYETSSTSTYLSALVHSVLNTPTQTCPCLDKYVSDLAGCLIVVDDLYAYCYTFYPDSSTGTDNDQEGSPPGSDDASKTPVEDDASEVPAEDDADEVDEGDDANEDPIEDDAGGDDDESMEDDNSGADYGYDDGESSQDNEYDDEELVEGYDDDESSQDDGYDDGAFSNDDTDLSQAQSCSEILIDACSYGLGLTYEEAISCAISKASTVGSLCQPLLNAILSSIASSCQDDLSLGCVGSLDSAESTLMCLQNVDNLSIMCKKRIIDVSAENDVPCSSEVLYYCKGFNTIEDMLSCLSIMDPVKLSYLCVPFIQGYLQCSDDSATPSLPGNGGKVKPKPYPQTDDHSQDDDDDDNGSPRKRKPKPKPRPGDGDDEGDGSRRLLRAWTRKYSAFNHQYDLTTHRSIRPPLASQSQSARHLQGMFKQTPCWMAASQASPQYPGSFNGSPQQPSLLLIAVVCTVSVFVASLAVTCVKRCCKGKVPADGKGKYAPAATSDDLDNDGAPAKSAISMTTFASSTREIDSPHDYVPPNAEKNTSSSSSYDSLPHSDDNASALNS